MFESFIWMFKKENFLKHFLYIIIGSILFFFATVAILFIAGQYQGTTEYNIFRIIAIILCACAVLLPVGYFWDLTETIIDRGVDYKSSNIYDGQKPKKVFVFELPEFKVFKHVWRGFASSIASILMVVPYFLLIAISVFSGTFCHLNKMVIIASYIMYCFLCPALLWNYARTNSVVATLHIFKAVNIIGNYFFQYIARLVLYIIIYVANYIADITIIASLKLLVTDFNPLNIVILAAGCLTIFAKNIFILFIYAYLLGTLAPAEEA